VHAEQFFAHFDTGETIRDTHQFLFKLNGILPSDISSKAIYPVKPTANARFDATSRTYNYKISRVKDPFDIHSSYYLFGKLNIRSMEDAAVILQEYKDFNCFCKAGTPHKTYECAVTKATWATDENQLIFTITANRFLRGMVRAIVGTMIEVGRKRIDMNGFRKIIEGKKREDSGYAVPAQGLYLKRIKYPESVFQQAEKTKGQ
jgi:tRNA pseudouridine38-40 synthase